MSTATLPDWVSRDLAEGLAIREAKRRHEQEAEPVTLARGEAGSLHWNEALKAADADLGPEFAPYIDRREPAGWTMISYSAYIAIRIPGLRGIVARYNFSSLGWRRGLISGLSRWGVEGENGGTGYHLANTWPEALVIASGK